MQEELMEQREMAKKEEKLIQSIFKMRRMLIKTEEDCSLKELWRWIKQLPVQNAKHWFFINIHFIHLFKPYKSLSFQIKLPVAKMLSGSTVCFKPLSIWIPVSPILWGKNFFRSFPTPWWCEMHPPYFMISSRAAS